MSFNDKSGCDEIELGKLLAHSRQCNSNWHGFGTAEVVSGDGERRIVRMSQPQIVFDPDETQPSDSTKPVDFLNLEEAAKVVRSANERDHKRKPKPESDVWLNLPTPSILQRFITWFWSLIDGRN